MTFPLDGGNVASPGRTGATTLVLAGCTIELASRTVHRETGTERLSELEMKLLRYLVDHPETDLPRDEIIEQVWGAAVVARAVDITVRRLRMKIETDHTHPRHVLSVRGVGYRFEWAGVARAAAPVDDAPRELTTFVLSEILADALPTKGSDTQRLVRRDEVLGELVPRHGGYAIAHGSDRADVAFSSVKSAFDYLHDVQQALWDKDGEIPVRFAVHLGSPHTHRSPVTGRWTYSGPVVRAAERLLDLARGNQALVSETAWRAAEPLVDPRSFTVAPLEPVLLPGDIHATRPLRIVSSLLVDRVKELAPVERTRARGLVGRVRELESLQRWVDEGRPLVTVHGTGGSGKTALAKALHQSTGSGVFVELGECRTEGEILEAVARAMELEVRGDATQAIAHALSLRDRMVLVLDNVEQIVAAVLPLVRAWLARAPGISIVITSRTPLGLEDEQILELAPLPLHDAVDLFTVRAAEAEPSFHLRQHARSVIEEIVERLDRLPLAIELAAARAVVLSPDALLARLDQRFKVLAGPGRARTMRATIAWSWDLLTPDERTVLAQASVFRGGFDADAAEAVIQSEAWVVDGLEVLQLRSLLRADIGGDSAHRFVLYESVRDFAHEKLVESGALETTLDRHRDHYLPLAERWAQDVEGPDAAALLKALGRESGNLSAVYDRGLETQDLETAARAALALGVLYDQRGPFERFLRLAQPVLEGPLPPPLGARLHRMAGEMFRRVGQLDTAASQLDLALALARGVGDPDVLGRVLGSLGNVARFRGDLDAADACYAEAIGVLEAADAKRTLGIVLGNAGIARRLRRDLADAERHYRRALDLHREVGNVPYQGIALGLLGNVVQELGRLDEAERCKLDALTAHRAVGARWHESIVLGNLGAIYEQQGRRGLAESAYTEARALAHKVGDPHQEGICLANLGSLQREDGRLDDARLLLEEALVLQRRSLSRRSQCLVLVELGRISHEATRWSEARTHFDEAMGLADKLGDADLRRTISFHRALLEIETGHPKVAEDLLRGSSESSRGLTLQALAANTLGKKREARTLLMEAKERSGPKDMSLVTLVDQALSPDPSPPEVEVPEGSSVHRIVARTLFALSSGRSR